MIRIRPGIRIDESEIEEKFVLSSGPGGQNVNKTATAVQLRFDVANSSSLPPAVKDRLIRLAGRKMSSEGVLVIDARRFRRQESNRKDARRRLVNLIRRAGRPPRRRKPTRPSPAARERRLKDKKIRSEKKRRRRPVSPEE